jgi:hypothetical protein
VDAVRNQVCWEYMPSPEGLDEARNLGVRPDLPAAAQPGDWCTVAVVDGLGEKRWKFVAVEPDRSASIFADGNEDRDASGNSSAPLGDVLRRTPQPVASASPSGSGLMAQSCPLSGREGGVDRPATGRPPRRR